MRVVVFRLELLKRKPRLVARAKELFEDGFGIVILSTTTRLHALDAIKWLSSNDIPAMHLSMRPIDMMKNSEEFVIKRLLKRLPEDYIITEKHLD